MYYVGKNGSQSGPYPMDELKNMAASGQLAPADLVWTDGMSEWKPAGAALPDVFPPAHAPTAPPPVAAFPTISGAPTAPVYAASAPPPAAGTQATLPFGATISTYLWQSIVVTLLCCLPLGIPAIIYSSQVESKRQHGDIAGAMNSSKNAKMWCWISLICGLLINLIMGVIFALNFVEALRHVN